MDLAELNSQFGSVPNPLFDAEQSDAAYSMCTLVEQGEFDFGLTDLVPSDSYRLPSDRNSFR